MLTKAILSFSINILIILLNGLGYIFKASLLNSSFESVEGQFTNIGEFL